MNNIILEILYYMRYYYYFVSFSFLNYFNLYTLMFVIRDNRSCKSQLFLYTRIMHIQIESKEKKKIRETKRHLFTNYSFNY